LEELAGQLSALVTAVEVSKNSVPPEKELLSKFTQLEKKSLDLDALEKLVDGMAQSATRQRPGFGLEVIRRDDLAGVIIRLDVIDAKRAAGLSSGISSTPGPGAPTDRPYDWKTEFVVTSGNGREHNSSDSAGEPIEPGEIHELLEPLFESPYERAVEARLHWIGTWKN
jgi:hypothetical protein